MTYKEAKEKAESLQSHVGTIVGTNNSRVMIITAAPTDEDEKAYFAARIGTPPYMNIEEALSYVYTKDFDILIVFENIIPDVSKVGWAKNYLTF